MTSRHCANREIATTYFVLPLAAVGSGPSRIRLDRQRESQCNQTNNSAAHFIEVFRTWYGPIHKAFASLPADGAIALEHDLTELLNGMNRSGSTSLVVPSEYLEIVVTRRRAWGF